MQDALEQLANNFFHCPLDNIHYTPQPGGFSTVSNLKINYQHKSYLLRVLPKSQAAEKKHQEIALTQLTGKHGIGPKVNFVAADESFLLIDYVQGTNLRVDQLLDKSFMPHVVNQLKKLHQLAIGNLKPAVDLFELMAKFISELTTSQHWQTYFKQSGLLANCKALKQQGIDPKPVLIHNDPNTFNIMVDNNQAIWLIDWTDGGVGCLYSDLSMLTLLLANEKKEQVVKAYFGSDYLPYHLQRTKDYETIRLALLTCWSLCQAQRRDPNRIIESEILSQKPDDATEITGLLHSIIEGKNPLAVADDFLSLTPVFHFHLQRNLNEPT